MKTKETSKVIKDIERHMFGLNDVSPKYIETWENKMRNKWVKPEDVQSFQAQLKAKKSNGCECVIL